MNNKTLSLIFLSGWLLWPLWFIPPAAADGEINIAQMPISIEGSSHPAVAAGDPDQQLEGAPSDPEAPMLSNMEEGGPLSEDEEPEEEEVGDEELTQISEPAKPRFILITPVLGSIRHPDGIELSHAFIDKPVLAWIPETKVMVLKFLRTAADESGVSAAVQDITFNGTVLYRPNQFTVVYNKDPDDPAKVTAEIQVTGKDGKLAVLFQATFILATSKKG